MKKGKSKDGINFEIITEKVDDKYRTFVKFIYGERLVVPKILEEWSKNKKEVKGWEDYFKKKLSNEKVLEKY